MIPGFSTRPHRLALLLGLLTVWLPLPFGSVTPAAQLAARGGAFFAVFLALLAVRRGSQLRSASIPVAALVALALLGWLQSSLWPLGLVRSVSPWHAEVAVEGRVALGLEPRSTVSISMAPEKSRSAGLSLAAAAAVLAAAAVAGRRRSHRRWLAAGLLAVGGFTVLYGLRHLGSDGATIWGREVLGPANRLRGTFVNPNHYAVYLEIVLAVAVAAGWWMMARTRRVAEGRRRWLWRFAAVAPVALMFTALVLTGSRAGLLAALLGTLAQALLVSRGGRWRGALAVIALLAVAGVLAAGSELGYRRALETSTYDLKTNERLAVWRLAVDEWQRYPWTGSGLGTFEEAFARAATPELSGLRWNRAHNDPVELLLTGGLVGIGLLLLGVAGAVRGVLRSFAGAGSTEGRAAALAAFGALVACGVHELFGFGLTVPANGLTLALVVGLALGVRRRKSAAGPDPDRSPGRAAPRAAAGELRG